MIDVWVGNSNVSCMRSCLFNSGFGRINEVCTWLCEIKYSHP